MKSKHSEHTPDKYERVPGRDYHSAREKQIGTAHEGSRSHSKDEKEKSDKR
jgi:hypothetical protein